MQFAVENPVDRGDRSMPTTYLEARHGSIWQMPEMRALRESTGSSLVHFSQCMIGAPWQKRTTILYSPSFEDWMGPLRKLQCNHSSHARPAGGEVIDGEWNSKETSAYPAEMNLYLAKAIASLKVSLPVADSAAPVRRATESATARDVAAPVTEPPAARAVAPAERAAPPAVSPMRQARFEDELAAVAESEPAVADQPERPPTAAAPVDRASKAWGTRLAQREGQVAGSPIRTRRSGRALLLCGSALLSLSPWCGRANLATATPVVDPRSRTDALAQDREGWTASMDAEMENHASNESWEWVKASELPRGRHLIKLVWVYKVKRSGKLKSRLCVQGCAQTAGKDFDQTYSGTMRSPSLRMMSCLAARNGMRLRRWDFVAAYLQGKLEDGECVYCHAPQGYEREGYICKVTKPVYGMAQAGRRWQRSLFPWLLEYGFVQSEHDPCVFHLERTMPTPKGPSKQRIVLGVYVDDCAVAYSESDSTSLYSDFTKALQERWNVEDEGELSDLLGIDFVHGKDHIRMAQGNYISKMASSYFSLGVPSASSELVPACATLPQHVADALCQDAGSIDPKLLKTYQSLVGSLLYCATNTRPDVAYAVGMLCRCMGKPTAEMLQAAERVLIYLYHSRDLGLTYEPNDERLYGMSDSDWATRHSTSGSVFVLNQAAISWSSKRQATIALSSCEAEIVAASEAAKEAIHLSNVARELDMLDKEPIDLHMDNAAGIDVAYNPEHHTRMKHVERRHFFVREAVEDHKIRVPFVSTHNNLADFFTKPLGKGDFFRLRNKIMNIPAHRVTSGAGGR